MDFLGIVNAKFQERVSFHRTYYASFLQQQMCIMVQNIFQNKLNIKTYSMAIMSYFSFYHVNSNVHPNLTHL